MKRSCETPLEENLWAESHGAKHGTAYGADRKGKRAEYLETPECCIKEHIPCILTKDGKYPYKMHIFQTG